ncbi:WYL domain-containing protein [Beggiatoa alba]|nr:WYL domain-containing protein [Beggiatoa alba]
MDKNNQIINRLKWANRQRLQYIEMMAFYTGVVTRSDVAKTFGLSDAAATKDLNLYNQIAPDNLIYKHSVFGFVPGDRFAAVIADLSPDTALPMIANNLTMMGGAQPHQLIYGVPVESLPLPTRLPSKDILAQIIRAVRHSKRLQVDYLSLSDRHDAEPEPNNKRFIEPHALINTGLRWHIRAYSEQTFDFRDFVLSRISEAVLTNIDAESSPEFDDNWVQIVSLKLKPHPKLNQRKRQSLLLDYNATDGVIELQVRGALLAYLLQRLSVDTSADFSMNPNAYQLVIVNRDEIEPFAEWILT